MATAVNRLAWKFPNYAIKTAGHSLGAALATHAGMFLLKNGYSGVSMINFGQPRVGDDTYASFATNTWGNGWRMTHCKDPVPHLPEELMGFKHSALEMYQSCGATETSPDWTIKQCNGSGEDPTCCDQWHTWQYVNDDHSYYLGQCIGEGCGQCGSSNQ